jgi:hypothetical protein
VRRPDRFLFAHSSLQLHQHAGGERFDVPGWPALDCPLSAFDGVVSAAINPAFVSPWSP